MFRATIDPPGVYFDQPTPLFTLTGVRMDVCAFVGVAPRGPARAPLADDELDDWLRRLPFLDRQRRRRSVAVAVESFDEYRRIFGGFEGPGRLPYAVQAFFEQGGRRAYIVRIVHDYGDVRDQLGIARAVLDGVRQVGGGAVRLRARDEGTWGNRLQAALSFNTTPVSLDVVRSTASELFVGMDAPLLAGSLLQATLPTGERVLATVNWIAPVHALKGPRRQQRVVVTAPLADVPTALALVDATLQITDGEGNQEVHDRLALSPRHPRSLAGVLSHESRLVIPDPAWVSSELEPQDARLTVARTRRSQFRSGRDRYRDITPDDSFDARWTLGNDAAGSGVHALVKLPDLAMVCVPDLYEPEAVPPIEDVRDRPLSGAEFEYCLRTAPQRQGGAPDELAGLRLNPRLPGDLAIISGHQRTLAELAETTRAFTALLDVPPGLQLNQILRWRQQFSSAFAAAYHPWILAAPLEDQRDGLIRIPPSAVGAGVIADQERRFGVPHGPANVIAAGAVNLDRVVEPADHAQLHGAGINVFVREPDGFLLSTARTLSGDPHYRQLSVRRVVTMIARTLEQQTQWMVFEPHTVALRTELRRAVEALLQELYRLNAFTGSTEEEAFFVRCDEHLNDQRTVDAGKLIAEIGIAPAEPLEFIIVRLVRNVDGRVTVEG